MVESESPDLDAVFHALGDATRRQMIAMLADGAHTVGELAEPFDISLAAVSKHVKVLERAGLVRREIQWRTHVCSLAPDPLGEAHRWLDRYSRFWTGRLDALEALLRAEDDDDQQQQEGEEE
ncbi:helix-turn-helix transcriptional regulator [Mangrovicoccus sp. HB161399]|uniref:ArsR/SmtB family transcription factor n=1 Tax=Mangrovicoccus sp. HB161399 TaxID=2720392 RepID=UPI0015531086|nr:metalloregulator ArsR/SmtB family transcription factor [Mangrovicoccus sp. HB161399]